jgi:imidazolonepropionase-like amidohydrolase
MKHLISFLILVFSFYQNNAQRLFPVNGIEDKRDLTIALYNANIHVSATKFIPNGILVIEKGRIKNVLPIGSKLNKEWQQINLKGQHIYAAFIDVYSNYGVDQIASTKRRNSTQEERPDAGANAWNMAIQPEFNAFIAFKATTSEADNLRKNGFGAVLSHRSDGIARGSGILVSTADGYENELVLKQRAASFFSFSKGSSTQEYPSSLMGSIALLRQTYLDADWYQNGGKDQYHNYSLEAFNSNKNLPAIFETNNWQSLMRADKIGDEFNQQYIIKSAGDEYLRADEIKKTNATLIVPVNFPQGWDFSDAYTMDYVPLSALKHWENAPANAAILAQKGVPFTFTAQGLKDMNAFLPAIRKCIEAGLNSTTALQALTEIPAKLLNADKDLGSLEQGKLANFIITSDTLFNKESILLETWVQGKRYQTEQALNVDVRGTYKLSQDNQEIGKIQIKGKKYKPEIKFDLNSSKYESLKGKINASIKIKGNQVNVQVKTDKTEEPGLYNINGIADTSATLRITGAISTPDGSMQNFIATLIEEYQDSLKADTNSAPKFNLNNIQINFPNAAFGFKNLPKTESYLIKNATIWTNEKSGIIENASLYIANGKIISVGKNNDVQSGLPKGISIIEIDAKNKHVTAGIIDEHSHIAISDGVNEGTQNNTAEVRIGDVVDSNDPAIYYQLAGGVTTSQLLHGSANPIGGQSAIIKLKWGETPENMKLKNAPGHIKFALGENVKQSNWGDNKTTRFPQTRMGVEQVYFDAFERAKNYQKTKNAASGKNSSINFKRDLELEALVEILEGKRFITCHSYVQSEINMLMHVGDSMGFNINTFTHILEGYKVADKMKVRNINASSFSDWWAYKFEVNDAIPYNGALLNKVGVNVGFNSDDAEMGRRLNQEAAKAVLYGGVSEEEAWKFVTLNPAKMLRIDQQTGSLKPGKDADVVIWNDHPLSIYAKPEKTFVQGALYFDIEKDKIMQAENKAERIRIIQKMMSEKGNTENLKKPIKRQYLKRHCDDFESEVNQWMDYQNED